MTNETSIQRDAPLVAYRPDSVLAVISACAAPIAVSALMWPAMLTLAAASMILGCVAFWRLQTMKSVVAGVRVAATGLGLSVICLFGGSAWHWHQYAIEVPPGYERIDLSRILAPRIDAPPVDQVLGQNRRRVDRSDRRTTGTLAASVLALDGRRVAVKAYMDPPTSITPAGEFTISSRRWSGFGSTPIPGEHLVVQLKAGADCEFAAKPVVVSGVFRVVTESSNGVTLTRLLLDDAIIRPATSTIGLSFQGGGNGC
jgi:hypothetical protein